MIPVTIIGAGAAGLFCAARLSNAGVPVTLIDNGKRPGRKILISGGGKCNFTNTNLSADNYISRNPHFCKSALSRYTPWDFLALVNKFDIPWHERDHGQLLCDTSAHDIVNMLTQLCEQGGVRFHMQTQFMELNQQNEGFEIITNQGCFESRRVIIATGGLSLPALGTTTAGYALAEQLKLPVIPIRAGLVPFTLAPNLLNILRSLSGVSVSAHVTAQNGMAFTESLLFTHRGLSGPVILQISNYWQTGETIEINLLPQINVTQFIADHRQSKQKLRTVLSQVLPKRVVDVFMLMNHWPENSIKEISIQQLNSIFHHLTQWKITPNGTEGYRTAEVTLGGVSTEVLSSKTFEVISCPNMYFIGEIIDVTGWLGGYNFQWAWSSAAACADSILADIKMATR